MRESAPTVGRTWTRMKDVTAGMKKVLHAGKAVQDQITNMLCVHYRTGKEKMQWVKSWWRYRW